MVYSFYVGIYSRQIFIGGTQRFTARDGFTGIPLEYHEPVKQYVAKNYTDAEIQNAFAQNWINQEEYDETMNYKYPTA